MAARPDYYKTLGVDKRASADEIKKAYRKLARQYHPDRNPGDKDAEARFKEISQAHDVLGDPEKRKQYDSGTGPFTTGAGPGGGFGGFGNFDFDGSSMGDILSNLFGGSTSGRRVRTKPRSERGADLEAQVSITFDQAVSGRAGAAAGADARGVPDLPRHRREAGHDPEGLPALRGPRHRDPGPGHVLDLPAVLAVRRRRHRDRGPVPDLPRQRRGPHRQETARQHPRRRQGRQPHPPRRQGRARPQRRAARRPLPDHTCRRVADVQAQGRQPRGRGAADDPRGAARRRRQGADAERHQDAARARPEPQSGTVQRLRGEGPPKLERRRQRRHPLPLRDRRARPPQRRAAAGGRRALADVRRRPAGQPVQRRLRPGRRRCAKPEPSDERRRRRAQTRRGRAARPSRASRSRPTAACS